ncbi:MAG: HPr family phosphocarrier protein [Oscillospiraceae bacterium]|nr:HPr family phosphocarrier protein [Oscillospiraceae bacterium]
MTKCKIKLGSITEVKEFTTLANSYDFELDLISGRYTVDARSIMGIFSLDLTKALTLVIHAEDEECRDFLEEAKKFIDD